MSEAEHLRRPGYGEGFQSQRCKCWLEYIAPTPTLAGDVRLKWLRWLVALGRIGGAQDGARRMGRS